MSRLNKIESVESSAVSMLTRFRITGQSPILVRAREGLISSATTADRFPITEKRYFGKLVLSITPDTFRERRTHCLSRNFVLLIKRTRHLKETRNLIRLFGYYKFISRSIENLEVDLRASGFAIDNYSFLAAFGFK